MSEERFALTILTGTVRLPEPTNRWSRDDRGFWYQHMSDRVVLNEDGSERSREPGGFAPIAMAGDGVREQIIRLGGVIVEHPIA